jgi:TolB-like protein/AraC-like DNA-binding protein/Tfp pilus assembly protein PilF
MSDPSFIDKAETLIVENLSNEKFGVSELAGAMSMSRSSLLRKIQKHTNLSASQFIRQVRLRKAMTLLKQTALSVSEISYQVGFGSTSYFIKCFREHFGYPPGEAVKKESEAAGAIEGLTLETPKRNFSKIIIAVSLISMVALIVLYQAYSFTPPKELEKSIVVLPFNNESSDSTNVYFINGLMESTLINLQMIEDFRVVSRTSAEKYSNNKRSIPEIAKELNVNYVVEGSGQRVGDEVLLNIQLIDASSDRPIWAEQYSRKVVNVFDLQNEIAKKIADAVEAIVTPAELEQIEKIPTENLLAYDYYLQALEPYHSRTKEGLEKAILLFKKAVEEDSQFSLAYANVAISYYFLDVYQKQKQYTDRINIFADKALLYDSKSAESLIAKALYYMQSGDYKLAVPHLEKALEYNPNSSSVVQMLGDLYARVIPNTGKYLEYALKGIQLDIAANDSTAKSYIYLLLSNALIQTGFVDEAMTNIEKSIAYNPENYYSPFLKVFILYAQEGDLDQTKKRLFMQWRKDTSRLDILQEVGKFYYYQEEYDSAFYFYEKFVTAREKQNLNIYPQEDIKIAFVYQKKGLEAEAVKLFNAYAEYCENDESIYKGASMAVKYIFEGENDKAIEQLKIFSSQDNYQYWILLFQEIDPIMKPLKSHPEFNGVIQKIADRFWEKHNKLKKLLDKKGLI